MKESLIRFDRRHRLLLLVLIAWFTLMVMMGMHGWSTPMWHYVIDADPPANLKGEVWMGKPRAIRSDDWLLDFPMVMAQLRHEPKFPSVNHNIGDGQWMLAPIMVPARDWIWFFRPFTWGYVFGADAGLAWMWWGLSLGLFYSFFLVFMLISRNDFFLSACVSLSILYSPYFQFWSLHKSAIAIHWALAFIGIAYLLRSQNRNAVLGAGLLLGWSLAGMALDHIYPPIAVTLGWLLPFAVIAYTWNHWEEMDWKRNRCTRLAAFGLAVAIAGGAGLKFALQHQEVISLISNTTYPGHRFSEGGGFPLWAFFSNCFLAHLGTKAYPDWLGNVCESASFIFSFPLIILLGLFNFRKKLDPWVILLSGYIAFVFAYTYWGVPTWIAKVTLLGMSTSNRTQMGLGVANGILLVTGLSQGTVVQSLSPRSKGICIFFWALILCAFGFWMRKQWAGLKSFYVLGATLFYVTLAYFWLFRRKSRVFVAALSAISLLYSIGFNPVVHGGADYFYKNPLSEKIMEIDRSESGMSRWVAMGDGRIDNLFRILGVKSLGGYHGHPHLKVWEKFDPNHKFFNVYNQCAFVSFMALQSGSPKFTGPSPGMFEVQARPDDEAFAKAGVGYFLSVGDATAKVFEKTQGFEKIFTYGNKIIFRRIKSHVM